MTEIYDILTELEGLAAEQAAARGLSLSDLAGLSRAIDDMDKAIATPDLDVWAEADDRFHKELVLLGGNTRVQAIVDMMSDQVRRARATTLTLRPLPTKSNEDHRKVYQAIKDGDSDTARDTHRIHRRHAKRIIIEILQKHRLRFV
jgi:DNA-binding GntR family transcriptional regulator